MIAIAVGVHVAIVAALPKARSHVMLTAPAAVAELAPHVGTLQVSAAQLAAPQQAKPAAPVVAAKPAPKPVVARTATPAPAPKHDENKTIDMRPRHDDEPVLIATPLPVTIVQPPSGAR